VKNNGEDLLKNGKCRLADIPATRDEVFMMIRDALQERGVYDTAAGFAYDVAEKARKGYYAEFGMDSYDTLKNLGFEDWLASYLLGVRYMSTKALSVLELWHIIVLTWYLTYYPKQYAEVIGVENIWEGDT
jgi:DNA polymerase III alpha subunit (gram-positive type)